MSGQIRRYAQVGDIYASSFEKEFRFDGEKNRYLCIKREFISQINEMKVPITIGADNIDFSRLFVFPDLERIRVNQKYLNDYINSETLIGHSTLKYCIIEGESQSGKSSLLQMLFLKSHQNGSYPLFLSGGDLNKPELDKVLRKSFETIYSMEKDDYDRYMQLPKGKLILFIDDLHDIHISTQDFKRVMIEALGIFSQIIITVDAAHSMVPQIRTEFAKFLQFQIKPLGHKKTNDLIINFHKLQSPVKFLEPQELLQKTRSTYDQVRHILGDKILPSYPLFVLTIIQSLEYKPLDLHESSYGYCYQTLIHLALINRANLRNDEIDSFMNFLKELAFSIYETGKERIDIIAFETFYREYSTRFIINSFERVREVLIQSQILKYEDDEYHFGYKYILYFLIAKHVADIINSDLGKTVIKKLFENLQNEKSANILVFITHHSKDIGFIEESMFSTMLPFEQTAPITLEATDPFYKQLNDITTKVFNDIIEQTRHPEEERDRRLKQIDDLERHLEIRNRESTDTFHSEFNEMLFPFIRAFRSIEIVGQIIRNRKGSLPIEKLVDLISELYQTGFRTIGYLGRILTDAKEEVLEAVLARIKTGSSKGEIENKVDEFFHFTSLQVCLGVFSRIVFSVGVKDLEFLFRKVAEKIDTPASKLVSFSINSYYNKIAIKEIRDYAKEFKNNFVAMQILKARVKSYIYSNHVNYKVRQQISDILNMKLLPDPNSNII